MLRKPSRRELLVCGFALAAVVALPALAEAQDYPTRSVRIIVPFPAGGTADAMPRIVADYLSRKWGQPVVVENRAGAGGNIGAEAAYRSEPDGYTLFSAPPPPLTVNHNLFPKLAFDPTQFVPLAVMGRVPNALFTNSPRIKINSVSDVIEYAKKNPGKVTIGTQGIGTTAHLTSELFQLMAGVKLQNVHYRGSAPALTDLAAGNIDIMFDNLGAAMSLVKGGKLRLIAVASGDRVPTLKDTPAVAETVPGFDVVTWFAIVAPPKTPPAIAEKLNADINEALKDPTVRKRLENLSAIIVPGTLQETADFFRKDTDRWAKVIKAANIKLPN